ncbi:hypothetical protein [Fodinibius sp.]|uniref:hypothetical protein n=1 Tax=Fodinibius sp. TaxID=1872440 RepID=UPI002ACD7593|nr:hypothetical protein [Fodinibius sp.]MDZ7658097.1 hypothetical protein [Fodinibius sp.]
MKKLLSALCITLLIAGCGISGDDGNGRFGAWEKVSSDRGEYRGIDSQGKVQMLAKSNGFSTSADTVDVDTLHINDDSRINISITENDLTESINHDLLLELRDKNFPYDGWGGWSIEYVTDSTAFDAETNSSGFSDPELTATAVFNRNCGEFQSNQEYLNMTYLSPDSTEKTVYNIRVDGMIDIVEEIGIGCK